MTQASPTPASAGSPLVRLLAHLAVADADLPHPQFSARLARFVDMPDSITLAGVHGRLRRMTENSSAATAEESPTAAEAAFRHTRFGLIDAVRRSFDARNSGSGPQLPPHPGPVDDHRRSPRAEDDPAATTAPDFSPYLRFYLAHQREFEFRIVALHVEVRRGVAGISPALARLAALDEALNDILQAPARRFLALVPGLLARRFVVLQAERRDWFSAFSREMEAVLLAELDVRLLPTRGLLDAAGEAITGTSRERRRPPLVTPATHHPRTPPYTAQPEVNDPS